ncbi:MAG: hypothetical protein WCJ42_10720 [Actinomycetes bacterium]
MAGTVGGALVLLSTILPWATVVLLGDISLQRALQMSGRSTGLATALGVAGLFFAILAASQPNSVLLCGFLGVTGSALAVYLFGVESHLAQKLAPLGSLAALGPGPAVAVIGSLLVGVSGLVGMVELIARRPNSQRNSWPAAAIPPVPTSTTIGESSPNQPVLQPNSPPVDLAPTNEAIHVHDVPTAVPHEPLPPTVVPPELPPTPQKATLPTEPKSSHTLQFTLVAVIVVVIVIGVIAIANLHSPGNSSGSINTATPTAAQQGNGTTTLAISVSGCDGCTLNAVNTSGNMYDMSATVASGSASLNVPTSSTAGLGFTLSTPDQGGNSEPVVILGLAGVGPGQTVSSGAEASLTAGYSCWAGTSAASVSISITATQYDLAKMDGSPGHSVVAFASPVLNTQGTSRALDSNGGLGTQDRPCEPSSS